MTAGDPKDIIYTPAEASTFGLQNLDYIKANKKQGIPIGLARIDKELNPLLPGDLVTVIGRPGNGKTGFMMRWARQRAADLRMIHPDRLVIYITLEQAIEQLNAFDLAADTGISITKMVRGEFDNDERVLMEQSAMRRIGKPLWFIGHSIQRRKKRPQITVELIAEALAEIERWNGDDKFTLDMVFIDYLQRIKLPPKSESKTIALDEILNRLKDGALAFGCPFVVGVQAKREVDDRNPPIPQMEDGQWTSGVEQVSDISFGVVRPRKYRKEGEQFGKVIVEGDNQMVVSLLKQKMGPANINFPVYFDPKYNVLNELEERSILSGGQINDTGY